MPARVEVIESTEPSDSSADSRSATGWWTPRLAGPVIAAAIVRLTLATVSFARNGTSGLIDPDTIGYLEPGRNLLLHGRFIANGAPDVLRTPGYPLFLALTSVPGLSAAVVANVILSVFSVLLVWKLGRAVFDDPGIALGAAWILAFEPISVTNSVILMSDPLFLVLLLLSMERLAVFLRRHDLRVLAVAGLWLAAATLVRPITYYLPVALALGLFVVLARVPGLRWKAPAVLLISVLPWLAAWQLRNRIEAGYGGFSAISDVNLYLLATFVMEGAERRSYVEVRNEMLGYSDFRKLWILNNGQIYLSQPYLARHPEQTGWNQGQRLAFMRSEGIHIIRAHFGVYLRTCFKSVFRTLFEFGEGSFNLLVNPNSAPHGVGSMDDRGPVHDLIALARTYPWIAAEKTAFGIVMMGLYLLAVRGLLCSNMQDACLWLVLGISLYFIAVSGAAAGGSARYRYPIMPAVCILAAAGFQRPKTGTQ